MAAESSPTAAGAGSARLRCLATLTTDLRGIQTTDSGGRVTFTTVYPGWYQGRATHIHAEVTQNGRTIKTTQIAFPEDGTAAVYRTGVSAASGQNTTTNARDGIFRDGVASEPVTLAGDTNNGYTGTFQIGIALQRQHCRRNRGVAEARRPAGHSASASLRLRGWFVMANGATVESGAHGTSSARWCACLIRSSRSTRASLAGGRRR